MTSRRLVVSSVAVTVLASPWRGAVAQAFKVPDPTELREVLKALPQIDQVIRGTTALRTLLSQTDPARGSDAAGRWQSGTERLRPLLALLASGEAQSIVLKSLNDDKILGAARASTGRAAESARKMEDALKAGGLAPGSPLANFLFRSFFQFDQFLVVHGQTKQRWYCEIFPIDLFC